MLDNWTEIQSFPDRLSAEAFAAELRSHSVPTHIVDETSLPGIDNTVVVVVPSNLEHRARFVLNSLKPTERELDYAATGQLGGDD